MVTASSTHLLYFHPYEKNGQLYISGDHVARSPAMYAALHVMDREDVDPYQLRVVHVHGTKGGTNRIEEDATLLDWAKRLYSLL